MKQKPKHIVIQTTFLLVVTLGIVIWFASKPSPGSAKSISEINADEVLFQPILITIQHPRCMNCHTATQFPRQNDARRRHLLGVMRGPDNHGLPGMKCSACHGKSNNDLSGVPGGPHWGLAPLSMAWEYVTPAQICAQLKDPERNGGKTLNELHRHLIEDPLVLWAWEPGKHPDGSARNKPPLRKSTWITAVKAWIEADAPCPSAASMTKGTE